MFAYSLHFLFHAFLSLPSSSSVGKNGRSSGGGQELWGWKAQSTPGICLQEWGMWAGAGTLLMFQLPFWEIWKFFIFRNSNFFPWWFLNLENFSHISHKFNTQFQFFFWFKKLFYLLALPRVFFPPLILRSFKIEDFPKCLYLL